METEKPIPISSHSIKSRTDRFYLARFEIVLVVMFRFGPDTGQSRTRGGRKSAPRVVRGLNEFMKI